MTESKIGYIETLIAALLDVARTEMSAHPNIPKTIYPLNKPQDKGWHMVRDMVEILRPGLEVNEREVLSGTILTFIARKAFNVRRVADLNEEQLKHSQSIAFILFLIMDYFSLLNNNLFFKYRNGMNVDSEPENETNSTGDFDHEPTSL